MVRRSNVTDLTMCNRKLGQLPESLLTWSKSNVGKYTKVMMICQCVWSGQIQLQKWRKTQRVLYIKVHCFFIGSGPKGYIYLRVTIINGYKLILAVSENSGIWWVLLLVILKLLILLLWKCSNNLILASTILAKNGLFAKIAELNTRNQWYLYGSWLIVHFQPTRSVWFLKRLQL